MKFMNRTVLPEKILESLRAVLPVTIIIFFLCFFIAPVPSGVMLAFIVGAAMLVVGMGLFSLGADVAMSEMGKHVGATVSRSRRLWIIIVVSLVVGVLITVSEPDLHVLAQQAPNIPNQTMIWLVAAGVGLFLVVAMLRIFFKFPLKFLLIGLYIAVFVLAAFVPKDFLGMAFDAGGVTTGPMTVPFIMALGVGVASVRNDENAGSDSFGLVALCSIGPILAVMFLGVMYNVDGSEYSAYIIPEIDNSIQAWKVFASAAPKYFKEVAEALLPIVGFFGLLQVARSRLGGRELIRIAIGVGYTYLGLALFLTGANVGFMPVGNYLGEVIGGMEFKWIIVPAGMILGYFIVEAEPAVHVLTKQVTEMTEGAIPAKAMRLSLSIGVAVSVGLSMLRILMGIPIMYLVIPGYAIALLLTFFVPPTFTAIAFDSGGVASGPMTATFLLPLAMGLCVAVGGDVAQDAFGVVAMVAMTPLITIQALGLYYKHKTKTAAIEEPIVQEVLEETEEIITFGEDE